MRTKKILINSNEYEYQLKRKDGLVSIFLDGKEYQFHTSDIDKIPATKLSESTHIWKHEDYYEARNLNLMAGAESMSAGSLKSPMPGKIFKIILKPGSPVKSGETILILEAMKMEHAIKSPIDGVVSSINYEEGEIVAGGVNLATVEEA